MTPHLLYYPANALVLSLVAGVPLLLCACLCVPGLRATSFRLLPWAPLTALLTVFFASSGSEVRVAWFFMGSAMGLDATGRVFLGITAVVWLFGSLSVYEKFKHDVKRFGFGGFFLASMAGNFGLILARDILGFYLFFALMSFSAYGLIAHSRTRDALKAGRVYLALVFLSELAMFTALVLMTEQGSGPGIGAIHGSAFSLVMLLLLFISFGVKVGALPFQSWMVLSYQEIPVAAAIPLAGAMVNAGVLGWLRFLPLGHAGLPGGAAFLIIIGAGAALYGVIYGLYQEKIARVLASSSISQMGLVTVMAGYGLSSPAAGSTALALMTLFAVHHSLAKTSLFLGYDLVSQSGRIREAILLAGLLIPCLSLAGLPLTSGAMLKSGLKDLTALGHGPWYLFGKVFLPLSSLGTTILMLHCIRLMRQKSVAGNANCPTLEVPLWLASVAAVLLVPWLWAPLQDLGPHSLAGWGVLQALWPLLSGAVLALTWFGLGSPLPGREISVLDFDRLAQRSYRGFMQIPAAITAVLEKLAGFLKPERLSSAARISGLGKWEKVLGRWSVVGLCYLLICIVLFVIMLGGEFLPGGS